MTPEQRRDFNETLDRNQGFANRLADEGLKLISYGTFTSSIGAAALTFGSWPLQVVSAVMLLLLWQRINWLMTGHLRVKGKTALPLFGVALANGLVVGTLLVVLAFHLKSLYEVEISNASSAPALEGAPLSNEPGP